MNELTGWQSQGIRAGVVMLFLFVALVACNRSSVRRLVVVAYPESWPSGEYLNCYQDSDPEHPDLAMLDCDVQAPRTPRSRMLVMDVKFASDYRVNESQAWTCQSGGAELLCRR